MIPKPDETTTLDFTGRYGQNSYQCRGFVTMNLFRLFLCVLFVSLLIYTLFTISNHGWNLLPVFFGDMKAMTWPGQFNFDFFGFLLLSGLWVSWRNNYTPTGIVLGSVAVFGGILFLSAYLLYLPFQTKGDTKLMIMGKNRT
jgi:hypothetical protein